MEKRSLISIILIISCFSLVGNLLPAGAQTGESVVALPTHELGDISLGMSAGPLIPVFFEDFNWNIYNTNLSVGGVAALELNAYLTSFLRLGAEIGGSFNISPQQHTLLLMPIFLKATYIFNMSRFEFPIFLGIGINICRYRDWSQVDFYTKVGVGGYWRYDANWAFGFRAAWWWDFQPTTQYESPEQARMAHFLELSPSLIYSF